MRDFIWIEPRQSDWKDDLRDLADSYDVTVADIIGPRRTKNIVPARHHAMHMLRDRGWSYPEIGAKLGGRDHSTVMYGIGRHHDRMVTKGRENGKSKTP